MLPLLLVTSAAMLLVPAPPDFRSVAALAKVAAPPRVLVMLVSD
jgi:hypothetical protein